MSSLRVRAALLVLAALSMAHVGSPDTFFTGKAGPYDVRVSVRLPGVIPGRAQVAVRVAAATAGTTVAVRAAQWNVGLKGAPPAEAAAPVPGDPALYAAELWFMTATSYQLAVDVDGPSGHGRAIVPVVALATAERTMAPWLGGMLAALAIFLTAGLLTIVGAAVRESVLPPGAEPDRERRRRGRVGIAVAAALAILIFWGGNNWWAAEASSYARFVLYRPFDASATLNATDAAPLGLPTLTLSIHDSRWPRERVPNSRYNALLPDHGKLMHLFLVRDPDMGALAHLHPIARTTEAQDFDVHLPPLAAGHYRVYGDIVHESGYAQTLVTTVDVPADKAAVSAASSDPDDSWFAGRAAPGASPAVYDLGDGASLVWKRDDAPIAAKDETVLDFSVRDTSGATLPVEPYMGMAAHVIVASGDGSVFAHLHPSGTISMAALQKFTGDDAMNAHTAHAMPMDGTLAIPYAFPKAGAYRLWVQVKRHGVVETAAFDVIVR